MLALSALAAELKEFRRNITAAGKTSAPEYLPIGAIAITDAWLDSELDICGKLVYLNHTFFVG